MRLMRPQILAKSPQGPVAERLESWLEFGQTLAAVETLRFARGDIA